MQNWLALITLHGTEHAKDIVTLHLLMQGALLKPCNDGTSCGCEQPLILHAFLPSSFFPHILIITCIQELVLVSLTQEMFHRVPTVYQVLF